MRRLLRSLFVIAPLLLPACGEPERPRIASLSAPREPGPRDLLNQRWNESAAELLRNPRRIAPPFADHGTLLAHEARGRAYAFAALEGQTLEVELARAAITENPYDEGLIFIDLYRVAWGGASWRLVRVEAVSLDPGRLTVRLPRTGEYVLRIQPDLLVNSYYGLRLELSAALEFPVSGRDLEAVQSVFGDPRDGGARLHEGIDIFAPRLTPVVAVSDGRAVPKQNDLGGNVVYLNAAGVSYYYAHLERAAMDRARRVRSGDVLGFVGNTGNAADTPPHLHFGIYDWGRNTGAVDPIPHLTERRFDEERPPVVPPLVETQPLSAHRLEPTPGGTIVWLPSPTTVPGLAEPGGLRQHPPGPLGSGPLGSGPLGSGSLDAVGDLARGVGRPDRRGASGLSDTAASRRGIPLLSQLQYGLRP